MALTFGVHTGQQNCSLEELRRLWRFVDQAGFDWLSIWDHFHESPPQQAVERVAQYKEAGAARVTIALRAPFDWEALQGYVEEVLPAFR